MSTYIIILGMAKDFWHWHAKKVAIDAIDIRPHFHLREIWFCYLGLNVGFEQDGTKEVFLRPVIVFQKFTDKIFWAIPLTRADKNSRYYFQFSFDGRKSAAILSQIRLIDAKRLGYKIGDMRKNDFDLLKQKFKALLP